MPPFRPAANLTPPKTEAELSDAAPAVEKLADPKTQKTYSFSFEWSAPNGTKLQGSFTNKILTIAERSEVDIRLARLNGGMPIESLPPLSVERNQALAWMSLSLKDRPDWAKDLMALEYEGVIFELWAMVGAHESAYFRGGTGAG